MVRELFREAFGHDAEVEAHAPRRIEFIGNHTDYNGGSVIGAGMSSSAALELSTA